MSNAKATAPDQLHGGAPRSADRRNGAGRRSDGDGSPGRIKPRKTPQRIRQPRVDPPEPAPVPADVATPEPSVDPDDLLQPGGAPNDAGDVGQDLIEAGVISAKAGFDLVKHPYVVDQRPLRMGNRMLQPGESVPGAETWPRVHTWVQFRKIRPRR